MLQSCCVLGLQNHTLKCSLSTLLVPNDAERNDSTKPETSSGCVTQFLRHHSGNLRENWWLTRWPRTQILLAIYPHLDPHLSNVNYLNVWSYTLWQSLKQTLGFDQSQWPWKWPQLNSENMWFQAMVSLSFVSIHLFTSNRNTTFLNRN